MADNVTITVVGELWGAFICFIAFLCMLFQRAGNKKDRCVRYMLMISVLMLITDACSWGLDGAAYLNIRLLLYATNAATYICEYSLLAFFMFYLWQMVKKENEKIPLMFRVFGILIGFECVSLLIGLPFGWFFTINESNSYVRGPLFMVSQVVGLAGGVVLAWGSIHYRSRLNGYERTASIVYCAIPVLSTFLQIFVYGYPTHVASLVVATLIIFIIREADVRRSLQETTNRELQSKAELELAQEELKAALQKSEMANQAKTIFLNNMSHDIRTPMNAILGFSKLMESNLDNPELMADYLKKIEKSGQYLLSVINNVLDMARIESGKMSLNLDAADLMSEEMDVVQYFEADFLKKNLTVIPSMEITHRYVIIDASKIMQVSMNLVSNAIKYTPEGGTIRIDFKEEPSKRQDYARYIMTISDNGIGMSPEFQEVIFESFSRERTTTESKVIGSGLGMSIVKRLVDLMGGEIELTSELGKGTTFRVIMEHQLVDNPNAYLVTQQKALRKGYDFANIKILLAEDNELNAEIAIAMLNNVGANVTHANDGIECVDILRRSDDNVFDLILMDVQMPNLNGYEAAGLIRQLENQRKAMIPIVAMTANAFEEDKIKAINAGMNAHLAKPIDLDSLYGVIEKVVDLKNN